jgi:hypothetical protein
MKSFLMKTKKRVTKPQAKGSKMPTFFPIDDEMKEFSAMLETELCTWPGVSKKPMFGYQGLYRHGKIFAALPRSRAMKSPNSILFKSASISPAILESAKKDSRVDTVSGMSAAGWLTFDLKGASDMKDALTLLSRAYEAAKKS